MRIRKNQKGYAAVEFTLALPIFLFFICVISEMGRLYIQYTTITKAVYNGARFAVQETYGDKSFDEIADTGAIINMVLYGSKTAGSTKVLSTLSTGDISVNHSGGYVTVAVNYQYQPLFLNIPYVSSTIKPVLSASSVMRSKQ